MKSRAGKFCALTLGAGSVAVLLVLGIADQIWEMPAPLLITSWVFFMAWVMLLCVVSAHRGWPVMGSAGSTFFVWLTITPLCFGWVYQWDRAGWIWSMISGYNAAMEENLSDAVAVPVDDFARQHPIFKIESRESSKLTLPRGEYQVDKTIIIPRGTSLTIAPGVTLRFGVGCSMIAYGAIIAAGTGEMPIVFKAQTSWRKWGVVGVVGGDSSVFAHTIFENGRQAIVNGVEFTGCLSLHAGSVEITHSRFLNLFGKDAVNVRHGRVSIRSNLFQNTYKDGLDLDGGAGEVSGNRFVNCGDEAIDLSDNEHLSVFGNQIVDARGGRLAADRNLDRIKSENMFARREF